MHHYRPYLVIIVTILWHSARESEVARGRSKCRTGVAVLTQLPVALVVARSPSSPFGSFLALDVDYIEVATANACAYTRWALMTLTDMFTTNSLVMVIL